MGKKDAEEKFRRAVEIAKAISEEMSWIYANHEILKASRGKDMEAKFIDTYAGNAWWTLRRTILNEIHISMSRVLDEDEGRLSFPNLYKLLQDEEVVGLVEENYKQNKEAYADRLNALKKNLGELMEKLRDKDSVVKSLIRHRHTRLAHKPEKPYSGENRLKWGDEEKLIGFFEEVIHPMEMVLLNAGNISGSTRSGYKKYAESPFKKSGLVFGA